MEFLTADDISKLLRVDRRRVYELFQLKVEYGGIKCMQIGRTKRVLRKDFEKWLEGRFINA